jgi:hypothetical protein
MRHPGVGIGILGVGVGLLIFVLDAAGVDLPAAVLAALALLALVMIVGGIALEVGVPGRQPPLREQGTTSGRASDRS